MHQQANDTENAEIQRTVSQSELIEPLDTQQQYRYIISDGSDPDCPSNIDYAVAKQQVTEIKYWAQHHNHLISGDLLSFCEGFISCGEFPHRDTITDVYFYWRFAEGTGEPIPVMKYLGTIDENIRALRALYVKAECGHI